MQQQSIFQMIQTAQKAVPVDVDALADGLGIKVCYKHLPQNVAGELVRVGDDEYQINVNNMDPRTRQRFTLAHELGHYVYHRSILGAGTNDDRAYRTTTTAEHYNSRIGPREETEANRFASSLLMPWPTVEGYIQQGYGLDELARLLKVSKQALSIRTGMANEAA